jgi:hypothetical protein
MMGLATAATLLGGQDKVADALGIQPRSLRAKLNADRGVSDADLVLTAAALEKHAARIIDHAFKLREEARPAAVIEQIDL